MTLMLALIVSASALAGGGSGGSTEEMSLMPSDPIQVRLNQAGNMAVSTVIVNLSPGIFEGFRIPHRDKDWIFRGSGVDQTIVADFSGYLPATIFVAPDGFPTKDDKSDQWPRVELHDMQIYNSSEGRSALSVDRTASLLVENCSLTAPNRAISSNFTHVVDIDHCVLNGRQAGLVAFMEDDVRLRNSIVINTITAIECTFGNVTASHCCVFGHNILTECSENPGWEIGTTGFVWDNPELIPPITLNYGSPCEDAGDDGEDLGVLLSPTTHHSADTDFDWRISLSELLRMIQFFNSSGYHPELDTEDGYAPGL